MSQVQCFFSSKQMDPDQIANFLPHRVHTVHKRTLITVVSNGLMINPE